jgi:hypothetical protein
MTMGKDHHADINPLKERIAELEKKKKGQRLYL